MRFASVAAARSVLLAVLTVCLTGCGDDGSGGAPDDTISQLIGPEGGTVELSGGGKVTIPAGALTETTSIKVTKLELDDVAPVPNNLEAAGKPYAFEPHGTQFMRNVTIEVPFDDGDATEVRPIKLDDEDDTSWTTLVGSEKNEPQKKLSIDTTSFSVILAARPDRASGVITLPDGAIVTPDSGTDAMTETDSGNDAATPIDAGTDAMTETDSGNDAATPIDAGTDAMVRVDRCLTNNGGCDALVSCTDNGDPQVICGACPNGTLGTGATDCVATTQEAYVKAGNTDTDDNFGRGIAIDGDTLVVGSAYESSTVAGGPGDNSAGGAGAVYVFVRSGNAWTQQAMLKASNGDPYDYFGQSVAVSGDTIVVGAPGESSNGINGPSDNSAYGSGAVYVFTRSAGTWTQQAYLKASNPDQYDYFGENVTIDGDTLAVTASGESSAATGVNGNQADNSASYAGAAYVFTRSGTSWSQQAYLKASNTETYDAFGCSIAVNAGTILVGAWGESSAATGINGDQSDNTAYGAGAAYVFTRSGTIWSQQAYLKPNQLDSEDGFGSSVAVSGDTIVIGTPGDDSNATGINGDPTNNAAVDSGAAHVFTRSAGAWIQDVFVKPSNTELNGNVEDVEGFGRAVAIDGDLVVIGSAREDSNATGINDNQLDESSHDAGAAYAYVRDSNGWSQRLYVKASNTDADDGFGESVCVSGTTFAVGAPYEASAATGINNTTPGQSDNTASSAGAVYLFR